MAQGKRTPLAGAGTRLRSYLRHHRDSCVGTLQRMLRAPVATFMTIAVMGIALALPMELQLLVASGRQISAGWERTLKLSAYVSGDTATDRLAALADEVRERADVAAVDVIDAEAGLAEFREHSGFGAALDALERNPLPHVLEVTPAADSLTAERAGALAAALRELPGVDLVQLDTQWIERFHALLAIVRRAVTVAGLTLAVAVMLIVGNTIRLDILNRRREIEVVKLIGASDAFIRRPFLYTGAWYGLAGGLAAALVVAATVAALAGPVRQVADLYGSGFELAGLDARSLGILLGIGSVLGWLGAWVATMRHIRAIEPR